MCRCEQRSLTGYVAEVVKVITILSLLAVGMYMIGKNLGRKQTQTNPPRVEIVGAQK